MKPLVASLLKRTGLALLVFAVLLIALRLTMNGGTFEYLIVAALFFGGLLWANTPLIKRRHRVLAVGMSLIFVPVLGFPALIGSFRLGRSLVEWEYKTQGFQMVNGCNAAAANMAEFDVFALSERLVEVTNSPISDKTQITRLQSVYVIAQDKARILSDDCRRRGHCDNYPWKANWLAIKPLLATSE